MENNLINKFYKIVLASTLGRIPGRQAEMENGMIIAGHLNYYRYGKRSISWHNDKKTVSGIDQSYYMSQLWIETPFSFKAQVLKNKTF